VRPNKMSIMIEVVDWWFDRRKKKKIEMKWCF